jgi:dUTP pyrophosphatase
MRYAGQFSKVSESEFYRAYSTLDLPYEADLYDSISLPRRLSRHAAGYQFLSTISVRMAYRSLISIPTGIKCSLEAGAMLKLYPDPVLGHRGLTLTTSVLVVDSCHNAQHEGHIIIRIANDNKWGTKDPLNGCLDIDINKPIAFGIFEEYYLAMGDVLCTK